MKYITDTYKGNIAPVMRLIGSSNYLLNLLNICIFLMIRHATWESRLGIKCEKNSSDQLILIVDVLFRRNSSSSDIVLRV